MAVKTFDILHIPLSPDIYLQGTFRSSCITSLMMVLGSQYVGNALIYLCTIILYYLCTTMVCCVLWCIIYVL